MVHPYLYESVNVPPGENSTQWVDTKVLPKVKALLDRIHVAVLGPGLGRDELMLSTVERIIGYLKTQNTPIVLDADALYLISQKPEIIKGYSNAILTPNVVEFKRLADAVSVQHDDPEEETKLLAKALGVTIMRKGIVDLIANSDSLISSSIQGSNRRAGGQGDTLTGTIATLLAWGKAYNEGLWSHEDDISSDDIPLLACFGGSVVTRYAARLAFQDVGRAMQATDVHAKVGTAYKAVIEADFKL
jgi:ATP-dependent NAD(P)H-hydrate dehydratase